jgi:hypothetical protein
MTPRVWTLTLWSSILVGMSALGVSVFVSSSPYLAILAILSMLGVLESTQRRDDMRTSGSDIDGERTR